MTEKKLVVDGKELRYNGIFDEKELMKEFDSIFHEKGYSRGEKKSETKASKTGRDIYLELRPSKQGEKTNVDVYIVHNVRIKLTDVKDVVLKKDGVNRTFQQGNILIVFDAWILSFYEHSWEQQPLFWFLRAIFDKFVYHFYSEHYEDELMNDHTFFVSRIKGLLNLYRY